MAKIIPYTKEKTIILIVNISLNKPSF